ncbi:phospholipase/Carboxylesteras-like protein [Rhizodiscina lignyota]|uniref:Phospholipase/Carboxylesteras-like protein n=1 Tax=Rhizodiscina lignyota TaxID=1504668 RepID=A0A9P4I991_9PEZI|nr:phospholipase/Carboxylesteras-like protein [Rhizodiscina lignyota]
MPGRLPTEADFPEGVTLSIVPPPPTQPPTNVLILLHGLGDTHLPFKTLASQLSLPETACISLRAPAPLPFELDGFHWGDDIIFDQSTGAMDSDTGFQKSTRLLVEDVILNGVVRKCGYKMREIMLFGFAQGGMVALKGAAQLASPSSSVSSDTGDELGGVISIGGALPSSAPLLEAGKKAKTPVLICKATSGSSVSDSAVQRIKGIFEFVEVKEWKRNGDGMMRNREEMLPIMQFFARRLRSRKGVPQGAVEIG